MVPLVETGETKQVGRGIPGGDRSFSCTADSRRVVIEDSESTLTGINRLHQDILVGHDTCEFEVTHGEVAVGITVRDQAGSDRRGKFGTPE
jgi:chromosome condensin MukBEF MukE localization factor